MKTQELTDFNICTELPPRLNNEIFELTECAINQLHLFARPVNYKALALNIARGWQGAIIESDRLKAVVNKVMPYNTRAIKLLNHIKENTALVIKPTPGGPVGRFYFVP